jgi:hypothetical protein
MANPNIVNVTSILGETVFGSLTSTLSTVLVSNPASSGKVLKINTILIANVNGTVATDTTIEISPLDTGTSTNARAIASTVSVPADATLELIGGGTSFYLMEDKSIIGNCTTAGNCEFIISYEVIS